MQQRQQQPSRRPRKSGFSGALFTSASTGSQEACQRKKKKKRKEKTSCPLKPALWFSLAKPWLHSDHSFNALKSDLPPLPSLLPLSYFHLPIHPSTHLSLHLSVCSTHPSALNFSSPRVLSVGGEVCTSGRWRFLVTVCWGNKSGGFREWLRWSCRRVWDARIPVCECV